MFYMYVKKRKEYGSHWFQTIVTIVEIHTLILDF